MKKKFLVFLSLLVITLTGGICFDFFNVEQVNNTVSYQKYSLPVEEDYAFKDENFYSCVVNAYNALEGVQKSTTDALTDAELEKITELDCKYKDGIISDLSGIEKLKNLTKLSLVQHNISSINLENNTKLKELDLGINKKLSSIDLSHNAELTDLYLNTCSIENINLISNTKLKNLKINSNKLKSIDLSSNTLLETLNVSYNEISELNLSANPNLTSLNASQNGLTKITTLSSDDGNNKIALSNLKSLDLSHNQISKIDLTESTNIETLSLYFNEIETIDLLQNKQLKVVYFYNNNLTTINGDNNLNYENLEKLSLNNNNLTNITINAPKLKEIGLYSNKLTDINESLKKSPLLTYINVSENRLATIDLTNNTLLTELLVNGNQLTSLDLTKNTALKSVNANGNYKEEDGVRTKTLKSVTFDTGNNYSSLVRMYLNDNDIENIDLSNLSLLVTLEIRNNKLKSFTIPSKLATLYINNNNLEYLDASSSSLNNLYVNGNPFKAKKDIILYVGEKLDITTLDDTNKTSGFMSTDEVLKLNSNRKSNLINVKGNYNVNVTLEKQNVNGRSYVSKLTLLGNAVSDSEINATYEHTTSYAVNKNDQAYDVTYKVYVVKLKSTNSAYIINEKDGYVFTGSDTDSNTIKQNLSVTHGDITVEGNKIVIKNGAEIVKSFDIVNYSSSKYDLTKDYIYLGKDEFVSDISGTNISTEVNGDYLIVKHNNDVVKQILLIKYKTDYDLTKEYLYMGIKDIDINEIQVTENDKVIKEYKDGVIKIIYKGKEEQELLNVKVVRYTSDDYVLTDKYIYTGDKDFVSEKITVTNGEVSNLDNNKIKIKYNTDTYSNEIDIASYKTDYKIGTGYIYIGKEQNIDVNIVKDLVNVTVEVVDGNKLKIKYKDDEEIETLDVINYVSSRYDLTGKYIDIKTETFTTGSIVFNNKDVVVEYRNGVYSAKYNDDVLESIKVVSYRSTKYDLTKDYIYTGKDKFSSDLVYLLNAKLDLTTPNTVKIIFIDEDITVKEFKLLSITFGNLDVDNSLITIDNVSMSYDDFISNINVVGDGISYKIYKNNNEVTQGNVEKNMVLKVLYNDSEVLEEYTITTDYFHFVNDLTNKEDNDKNYITNLTANKTVSYIKNNINTNGTVKIVNQSNKVLSDNTLIATGYKVIITLSNNKTYTYTLIVRGDITGDGYIDVTDVMKLATHIVKGNVINEDCYLEAGKVTGYDTVAVTDVMKIANYIVKGGVL